MGGIAVVILIAALIARPGILPTCLAGVLVLQTCLVQSLLASLADNTALYGGLHALDGLLALGIAGSCTCRPGDGRHEGRRAARDRHPAGRAADHVPAGRRAAWMSAGAGAAVVLAAVADVALTFLARDDFKGNDLVFNLAVLAAAVAYATLGALVVRRAGSLIGWLMLAESVGLAFSRWPIPTACWG